MGSFPKSTSTVLEPGGLRKLRLQIRASIIRLVMAEALASVTVGDTILAWVMREASLHPFQAITILQLRQDI